MKIFFTNHAKERLNKRGITQLEAVKTLQDAVARAAIKKGQANKLIAYDGTRSVVFILGEQGDRWVIITAYYGQENDHKRAR